MKDIIKKYQNHKLYTNISIILASLVLAVIVNIFLVDGTSIGQNLKASVLNNQVVEQKSDIYIDNIENNLYVIANKDIKSIDSLSLSITYNPNNLNINNISSDLGEVINLSNNPGVNSIILNTNVSSDIKKGDKLLKIVAEKDEEKSENLNIINANFKDINNAQYLLSTSGITF